jgi:hypothetical protein
MGWELTPDGHLLGEIDGVDIRAYEGSDHAGVLELTAPGLLPVLDMVPRDGFSAASPRTASNELRDVATGDLTFDRRYQLRAAEPWLARAVVDNDVRRSLLAAPAQSWITTGHHLVARGRTGLEPLDLLARATALRAVIASVPWEAYPDHETAPSPAAVQAVMRARRMLPHESLPSMPRRA